MKNLLPILLIAVFITACRKDSTEVILLDETTELPVVEIFASALGKVTDESGNPLKNIRIEAGELTTFSNEQGFFAFDQIIADQNNTVIRFVAEGFFPAAHKWFPGPNSDNYIQKQLIRSDAQYSGSSSLAHTIQVESGGQLEVPSGQFLTSDNTAFEGDFQIAARYFQADDPGFPLQLPSDLTGRDSFNQLKQLSSYAWLALDLRTASGHPLGFGNETGLSFSLSIAPSHLEAAPDELSLWKYDHQEEVWRESGKAYRNGPNYLGQIREAGHWLLAEASPLLLYPCQLISPDDRGIEHSLIRIRTEQGGYGSHGITDASGQIILPVPKNEKVTLEWSCVGCTDPIVIHEFTPTDNQTVPAVLKVEADGLVSVNGRLVQCENTPVEGGILQFQQQAFSPFLRTASDGLLRTATIIRQKEVIAFQGQDLACTAMSESIEVPFQQTVRTGMLSVCEDLPDEYILLELNQAPYLYVEPVGYLEQGVIKIRAEGEFQALPYLFYLRIDGTAPGIIEDTDIKFQFEDFTLPNVYQVDCSASCGFMNMTIEEAGAVGERISGYFEGTIDMYDEDVKPVPSVSVRGEFQVIRTE
jgi:hypothetical protein